MARTIRAASRHAVKRFIFIFICFLLITLDEKGDATEAVNAYNSLVDQGVVAIIGDVTSKPCIAVAELAAEDRARQPILIVSPLAAPFPASPPEVLFPASLAGASLLPPQAVMARTIRAASRHAVKRFRERPGPMEPPIGPA